MLVSRPLWAAKGFLALKVKKKKKITNNLCDNCREYC